jgi:hypothetical protein
MSISDIACIQYINIQIPGKRDRLGDDSSSDLPYASKFSDIIKRVNVAKALWDPYRYDKKFQRINRLLYPFDGMKYRLTEKYQIYPPTNAWLKTYEMLFRMKQKIPDTGKYTVFFNANAPGASTCAFDYFVKVHKPNLDFDWVASTYLDSKTALQDSYGLIHKFRRKWLMDETNNGDVRSVDNILDFVKKIRRRFGTLVDFYFSDIAIQVDDYNDEERLEMKEVFAQNICALMTLKPGGIMIVKQRAFMLPFNIWMISRLAIFFNKFTICKPITSRPANSEVYLIGIGFTGISPATQDELLSILCKFKIQHTPYRIMSPIHLDVAKKIYEAAEQLSDVQIKALQSVAVLYEKNKTRLGSFHSDIDRETDPVRDAFETGFELQIAPNNVICQQQAT